MHRLKPFLNVGLNNFLSLRLQKVKEHQSKEKNRLYQIGNQEKYKYYRDKICSIIRLRKKHYYCAFFNNNLKNMKKKNITRHK